MSDFYITLFSNSSTVFYSDNKTSSFTVQIPRHIILDYAWEVALTEIQYPYSFFTVQRGQNVIEIKTVKNNIFKQLLAKKDVKNMDITTHVCAITPGFFLDISEIISSVNSAIFSKTKIKNFFEYNKTTQRTLPKDQKEQENENGIISFKPLGRLALQLGYKPNEEVTSGRVYSPHIANVLSGVPDTMLVYCDIIEPQITGDQCTKVLRSLSTVPQTDSLYFAKPCSVEFTQLQYIPLQTKNFEKISIDIRDVHGKLLPFEYGTLSVKLHFRKRHY